MDDIGGMEMITHLSLEAGVTLEVEFDYEERGYAYFGDLEALTEPIAKAKSALFLGVDVLPLIKALGLSSELNLIIVANMGALE
jgi:hypothetical protein